ncbi:hypothetical protein Leryth_016173 [Lithospermum erythrorhizon]|nr:hypothetical protein Leryth_016173 [Lithospermum erythrorhizon]
MQYTYVVVPGVILVVDDGSSKTTGWVDAGSSNRDGGQVNQEHCKSDGERSQKLQTYQSSRACISAACEEVRELI